MREIITKEQRERKSRRNQLIIGLILITLMLLSSAGYALINQEESTQTQIVKYKGISFERNFDYWLFQYDNNAFETKYNPIEVENISANIDYKISDFSNKALYFVTDSGQPNIELARNINTRFALRIQNACIDSNCSNDLPIKSCSSDYIIIVKEPINEKESIYQKEKCIFIIAREENQTQFVDKFIFKILGI